MQLQGESTILVVVVLRLNLSIRRTVSASNQKITFQRSMICRLLLGQLVSYDPI